MSRRPKAAYCLLDRAPAFGGLTNVGAQEDGFAARFEDLRGDGMAALLVAAGDGDLGALFGEQEGSSLADAGGASGDESDFVFQDACLRDLDVYVAQTPRLGGRAKLARVRNTRKPLRSFRSAGQMRTSALRRWRYPILPGRRHRPPAPFRSRTMTHRWPDTARPARSLPACRPGPAASCGFRQKLVRWALPIVGPRCAAWPCRCRRGRCSLRESSAARDRWPWPWSAAPPRPWRRSTPPLSGRPPDPSPKPC